MTRLFDLDMQLLHDSILLGISIFFLFLIMSYNLFNPVRKFMADRQNKIKGDIDAAIADKTTAAAMKADYEEKLKNADTSAMITLSEDMRRMQDMMKMYGMSQGQMGTEGQTLVLNANNALVQYVLNNPEGEHVNMFCQQIYDLALLSHCPLSAEAMTKFVARSNEILKLLAK